MHQNLRFEEFPLKSHDKVRYVDTDRQGHVNNAVFSSFLETGRVDVIYNDALPIRSENGSFVIASLKMDFLNEIRWPGEVNIGTGILKIGNSSMVLYQKLFQDDKTVATAETVIVQVNNDKSGSLALSSQAKETLRTWLIISS